MEPVLHGLGYQHEPAGDVARGVDVRHVGAEVRVDGDVAPGRGVHAGGRQVQPDGVGLPTDGAHSDGGFDRLGAVVAVKDHPYPGIGALELHDAAEAFADVDAGAAEGLRHHPGDVFVFGHQDVRPGLEQQHAGAEFVEDGGDLCSGRSGADDQE